MKAGNNRIWKKTGLFLAVLCLLCFVREYSIITAMAEEGEHFVVEEESSFGGTDEGTDEGTEGASNPSSSKPNSSTSNSTTPNSPNPDYPSPSDKSDAGEASGRTIFDMPREEREAAGESVSDNNAEFVTPAKGNSFWNFAEQKGDDKEISKVSENAVKEDDQEDEQEDNKGEGREDNEKEYPEKNSIPEEENPKETSMPVVFPATILLLWGIIRIIKRLRIVYGKL